MSYGEYAGNLRGLIHLLKYDGVLPARSPLGEMLAETLEELLSGHANERPLLVAVPLHRRKRGQRGFNQAELITQSAAEVLADQVEVATDVLLRRRDTVSQVGLSRDERIANMRDAFRVPRPRLVKGRLVVVVDDVMTTGTTLSECARVLKQAGAERVLAATVARAFQGELSLAADHAEEVEEAATAVASS